ncbi:hypothetical protein CN918_26325 [Priestia megaterium]|nr:hypothetical protein CN918_26325 [Priestia megaterium]
MTVLETQFDGGKTQKRECDLCMEEPENKVLIEKPSSMIIDGQLILSHRPKPLHICLDCLMVDIENM